MVRCPICGTSDFPQGQTECVQRHHREAVGREEKCEVDAETLATVMSLSPRLKDFSIIVQQKDGELFLDFLDPELENILDNNALRRVVLLLWDNDIPPEQIFRLRLDEPVEIDGVIDDGIDALQNGAGRLTREFRSHVLRWFEVDEGDMAERLNALDALRKEFQALVDAATADEKTWDETDRRVYEFMSRIPDQQIPRTSLIPRAIAGLETATLVSTESRDSVTTESGVDAKDHDGNVDI